MLLSLGYPEPISIDITHLFRADLFYHLLST